MAKYHLGIIGGGAAGICAAISAARRGTSVIICEKLPQIGKKILATGNGRCNLLNEEFGEQYYNAESRTLVASVFLRFGKTDILEFFSGLGLQVYSSDGRVFPVTNQAASVLKVLEMEINRLKIPVELNFDCQDLAFSEKGIKLNSTSGRSIMCQNAVITGGGKTYPAFGSDGSTYQFARRLGHYIIEPVPSAVPLVIKDPLCTRLQGQRVMAAASGIVGQRAGEKVFGELLFTNYGLSGTCILDVSEDISIAINRKHETPVFVSIDLVPFMDKTKLVQELQFRKSREWTAGQMLSGILPNKFCIAFQDLFEKNDIPDVAGLLKDHRFKVAATRGWNEAEFTSGGVETGEIKPGTLESKFKQSVYFAGEVLNVNGRRGGYNLAWAWASGIIAGRAG